MTSVTAVQQLVLSVASLAFFNFSWTFFLLDLKMNVADFWSL